MPIQNGDSIRGICMKWEKMQKRSKNLMVGLKLVRRTRTDVYAQYAIIWTFEEENGNGINFANFSITYFKVLLDEKTSESK